MVKIQIKSIWGEILFEHEKESNTIKDTLEEAVKQGANLVRANLVRANLVRANLYGANLDGANLVRANLYGASNIPFIPYACPSDGAFIGWKKVNNCLVKLEIPEDARRCSCTSQKCRCDKARVLEIIGLKSGKKITEIVNTSYSPVVTYKVGEMVYPDSFDENRWNECSHGIHFFINKQNAIDY